MKILSGDKCPQVYRRLLYVSSSIGFFILTRLDPVAYRERPILPCSLRLLTNFGLHDSMLNVIVNSYFPKLDRDSVSVVVSSTLHHQVGALRNALYNQIACKAAMRVVIPVLENNEYSVHLIIADQLYR